MSPACKERGRLAQELPKMGAGMLSLVGLIPANSEEKSWVALSGYSSGKKLSQKKKISEQMLKKEGVASTLLKKGNSFKSNADP